MNHFTDLDNGIISFASGMILSITVSHIWEESIHVGFVVLAGVLGAVAIYFTNKFLKKYFP